MSDKLEQYVRADELPSDNRLWPLYGAGFENLGVDGQPISARMPVVGPDELLVRHDACGICFSDIKVINAGEEHPRIFRDMKQEPVVLGHEIALTVAGVGENLAGQYRVGDRFIVQADIYYQGVNYAYGYMIQGGMSQYAVIDRRILDGDDGNYLLPVQPTTGYAESALAEPWACVIATYQLTYRTALKPGGVAWLIGTPQSGDDYFFSSGFDESGHPARLVLTNVPPQLAGRLEAMAARLGIEVSHIPVDSLLDPAADLPACDDIIVLGPDPDLIEAATPRLADFGIMAIIATAPLSRPVQVDVGRVHYNRWTYVGGPGPDIAQAYSSRPIEAELTPGGKTWFVGAGGPMGHMHAQRAVQLPEPPAVILCTARTPHRLVDLAETLTGDARERAIAFDCLDLTRSDYTERLAAIAGDGFDQIIVLAPSTTAIAEAAAYLAPGGVMNIFAGLVRGTLAPLDLSVVYQKNVRFIGHTASTIDDLRLMLQQTEAGHLSPNRSVKAIGSLDAARAGLMAVRDAIFPGKVVIFPQIKHFPLTPLEDLKETLPSVAARLNHGREWTVEAEQEFLRLMLP
ncbi:MAG TPA: alcohol dehydrogenase catalytic domain-containing protein [Anaerolineae bacterium]|nr:alcohol dehydrogenase catalytic domain-containing protein [Anaerolineae bacterium]